MQGSHKLLNAKFSNFSQTFRTIFFFKTDDQIGWVLTCSTLIHPMWYLMSTHLFSFNSPHVMHVHPSVHNSDVKVFPCQDYNLHIITINSRSMKLFNYLFSKAVTKSLACPFDKRNQNLQTPKDHMKHSFFSGFKALKMSFPPPETFKDLTSIIGGSCHKYHFHLSFPLWPCSGSQLVDTSWWCLVAKVSSSFLCCIFII